MNASELIAKAYGIAKSKGFNQSTWSEAAGHAINGQTVCVIRAKNECKLSTLIDLLDAIDCELEIKEI